MGDKLTGDIVYSWCDVLCLARKGQETILDN
jgi:hypothetical protein